MAALGIPAFQENIPTVKNNDSKTKKHEDFLLVLNKI